MNFYGLFLLDRAIGVALESWKFELFVVEWYYIYTEWTTTGVSKVITSILEPLSK